MSRSVAAVNRQGFPGEVMHKLFIDIQRDAGESAALEKPRVMKKGSGNVIVAVVATALAWLVPGAGHVLLGRTLRGMILFVCINGLFWAGVAVGGVFTVDPYQQRLWAAAQLATGTSGLVALRFQNAARQKVLKDARLDALPPNPDNNFAAYNSWMSQFRQAQAQDNLALVYPADTVAQSYSGVAGLLNFMCIIDALLLGLMGRKGELTRLDPLAGTDQPRQEGAGA